MRAATFERVESDREKGRGFRKFLGDKGNGNKFFSNRFRIILKYTRRSFIYIYDAGREREGDNAATSSPSSLTIYYIV